MSLQVASINSGSNGNCYYIGNDTEAVLIDAGISCRETEKRMARMGLSMKTVKAIFISHEHSDHINGVAMLSKKYNLPVYITSKTHRNSRLRIDIGRLVALNFHEAVEVGGISVLAFPKRHDAIDPCSFLITGNGVNIGVLTDIGSVCDHVAESFRQCHAVFLEANYDEEMLDNGPYPVHLKRRIKSDEGHLSNHQAVELFLDHRGAGLSHVFLSHLSKENNSPQRALEVFNAFAGNTQISVASRNCESPVFEITADHVADIPARQMFVQATVTEQLRLL